MIYLRYIVPFLVFGFFILRSKRSSIYLISIPLVLLFGRAIYLNIFSWKIIAPGGIGLGPHDILLILQFIGWWYIRVKRPDSRPISKNVGYRIGLIVLFYYGFLLLSSLPFADRLFSRQILYFPRIFFLPIGFLLMLDTYRRFSRNEILMLLRDLSFVTVFLSCLYILNATYSSSIYEIWDTTSTCVTKSGILRNYGAYPYWALMALIYFVSSPGFQTGKVLSICILLLASLFYYSRAFLLIALLLIVFGHFFILAKKRNISSVVAPAIVIIVLLILFPIAKELFPVRFDYFSQRFEPMKALEINSVHSVASRIDKFKIAWMAINRASVLTGSPAYGAADRPYAWVGGSYDSDYYPVIVFTGIIGVVLYLVPQLLALGASVFLISKRNGDSFGSFRMSLIAGLYILGGLIWSIVSINYMYFPTLSTFALVLISLEAGSLWMQPEQVRQFSNRRVRVVIGGDLNWFFIGKYRYFGYMILAFLAYLFTVKVIFKFLGL